VRQLHPKRHPILAGLLMLILRRHQQSQSIHYRTISRKRISQQPNHSASRIPISTCNYLNQMGLPLTIESRQTRPKRRAKPNPSVRSAVGLIAGLIDAGYCVEVLL
jgi:hypothetical protein